MPTLRWPADRGRFIDRDPSRVEEPPRAVAPGETVDVSDDVADHYLDRGFQPVEDDDEDLAGYDDVGSFLDRTPVEDVADDIEAGAADGYLDDVYDQASRATVEQAVEDRRAAVGGG